MTNAKTDTRLAFIHAAAAALTVAADYSSGEPLTADTFQLTAHGTAIQRALAALPGATVEEIGTDRSPVGRPYAITRVTIGRLEITAFSREATDYLLDDPFGLGIRVDPTPTPAEPFMAEAVPEQILDDEDHDDCDDEDCQKCQHVAALAAARRADEDAEAAARGAQRMRTIVGLADDDLDPPLTPAQRRYCAERGIDDGGDKPDHDWQDAAPDSGGGE